MEQLLIQIPSWIVTAAVGLIGIGIGWGFIRSEVNHLKEEQENQRTKIEELDSQKLNAEFKTDCGDFREQCQDGMKAKFDDIKFAINKNREVVTAQFQEIREFIGYVKRVVQEINGKSR